MKFLLLIPILFFTGCSQKNKFKYNEYIHSKSYSHNYTKSSNKEYLKFSSQIKKEELKSNKAGMKRLLDNSNKYSETKSNDNEITFN